MRNQLTTINDAIEIILTRNERNKVSIITLINNISQVFNVTFCSRSIGQKNVNLTKNINLIHNLTINNINKFCISTSSVKPIMITINKENTQIINLPG